MRPTCYLSAESRVHVPGYSSVKVVSLEKDKLLQVNRYIYTNEEKFWKYAKDTELFLGPVCVVTFRKPEEAVALRRFRLL